jgi:hypothetical protein
MYDDLVKPKRDITKELIEVNEFRIRVCSKCVDSEDCRGNGKYLKFCMERKDNEKIN